MPTTMEDTLTILRTAIDVEDNGLETYLKYARQTKDETGKNIFIQLALDEHNHRQILGKQFDQLMSTIPYECGVVWGHQHVLVQMYPNRYAE